MSVCNAFPISEGFSLPYYVCIVYIVAAFHLPTRTNTQNSAVYVNTNTHAQAHAHAYTRTMDPCMILFFSLRMCAVVVAMCAI